MNSRLRQSFWIVVALVVGYVAGNGPLAEWIVDVYRMLQIEWLRTRLERGPNSGFPLLVSGFLIGQGIYLVARRLIAQVGPTRTRQTERLAAWDPSLNLPRRFGLYRYLTQCAAWSLEDPTTRTQSLALLKIRGLGSLNDEKGSLVATKLLQRIAVELRFAALPDETSPILHWATQYFPRPMIPSGRGMPFPRYAARWSGSTFALAFRELDAVQVISVVRAVSAWTRGELSSIVAEKQPTLSVGIAIGTSNVSPRALTVAAVEALQRADNNSISVVCDPSDLRREAIAQMSDIHQEELAFADIDVGDTAVKDNPESHTTLQGWVRAWGPPVGCFAATFLLLQWTGGAGPIPLAYFPWPDNIQTVQVIDDGGYKIVHLLRNGFPSQSVSGWTISNAMMTQGDPNDGTLTPCQIHLDITNGTGNTFYVSAYDFAAKDSSGRQIFIDPSRMLRIDHGIAGRWLAPGETWSGWLYFPRRSAIVRELVFQPDRFTQITLRASET